MLRSRRERHDGYLEGKVENFGGKSSCKMSKNWLPGRKASSNVQSFGLNPRGEGPSYSSRQTSLELLVNSSK